MRGALWILSFLILFLFVSGAASAATIQFTAKDPADVTNPDFDIVKFGASDHGNIVDFWLEVRGKINNHPDTDYLNGYEISIEGIEMVAVWFNVDGNTQEIVYMSSEDGGMSTLSPGQYEISGGKLTFHIDKVLLQNIGDEYVVNVYTGHLQSSTLTTSFSTDEAVYHHYASGGSSGGSEEEGSSSSGGGFPLWAAGIAVVIIIVVVLFVVYFVMKRNRVQYPPQQPPVEPPEPPEMQ